LTVLVDYAYNLAMKATFKKFGIAGILFFTLKGLAWLLIPYLIAKGWF